jgi:hypothetical protein
MPGYSPTVTGHFCNNLIRLVPKPYINGMKPPLKERAFTVSTYCSAHCSLLIESLTATCEKALSTPCRWKVQCALSEHWRSLWGAKDHPRWLERDLVPQDHKLSPPGEEDRGGPCGAHTQPRNRRVLKMCSWRLIKPLPLRSQQNPRPLRSFNCCKHNYRTFSKNETGSRQFTRPAKRQRWQQRKRARSGSSFRSCKQRSKACNLHRNRRSNPRFYPMSVRQ